MSERGSALSYPRSRECGEMMHGACEGFAGPHDLHYCGCSCHWCSCGEHRPGQCPVDPEGGSGDR